MAYTNSDVEQLANEVSRSLLNFLVGHNGTDFEDIRSTGNSLNVNTAGTAGTQEPIIITCDGTDDVFTDPTAPVAAELYTISGFTSGARRVLLSWHQQAPAAVTDIAYASMAVATINAGDDTTAISRLTVANNGVGDYSAFKDYRALSLSSPIAFWYLAADVTRIDIGFLPPVGTGAIPVRVNVEVW